MRKTPSYSDGNTRDPRNPPDNDLDDTKGAERAIEAADRPAAQRAPDKQPEP